MLTKTDIKTLRIELRKDFVTKKEFKDGLENLHNLITNAFDDLMELLNPALKQIDEMHKDIKDHTPTVDNHERRIEKLEEKVFAN